MLAIANALLDAVECLPPDASGAFVVTKHDVDRGMVVAERNRVCWAMATGLEERLKHLMVQNAGTGLDRRTLTMTPGIAAALRQHSVESLISLCGPDEGMIRWIPRDQPLHAQASFAPTELLAAIGAHLYSNEAQSARRSLQPSGAAGASFAIGDDDEVAVVQQLAGERLGVSSLLELGDWAAAALDASPGFAPQVIEKTVANASQTVALAWRAARRVVQAVILEDRPTIDHAVTALRDQRIPAVVSICVPWKLNP
ncbi:MAG TPA: hypothetical protein VGC41_19935 [Kofleriaceae bacterium]